MRRAGHRSAALCELAEDIAKAATAGRCCPPA